MSSCLGSESSASPETYIELSGELKIYFLTSNLVSIQEVFKLSLSQIHLSGQNAEELVTQTMRIITE